MGHYLIAGASSGIGASLSQKLLKGGHTLTAISRKRGDLAAEITHHLHDFSQTQTPLPQLDETFDGFVYLPGTINLKPFKQYSIADFQNDWELNVLGAAHFIQTYLSNLNDSGSSIVLMSSVAASVGMAFHASIGSAKAAVEGLTRALAAELSPKIRVNAVAPSLTKTPLAASLTASSEKEMAAAKKHPLNRLGAPEDISEAIAFLLSSQSSWMTGQILHVDGGFSAIRPI